VRGRHVGQVLFESFDRLEHTFRARVSLDIAGRIERKPLRHVKPGELVPATVALGVVGGM
jgi:hypothetical protein